MVQQVVISTDTSVALRPLIESAIRSELAVIDIGIDRTKHRLRAFEQQHGLTSEEFWKQFEAGQIPESLEFTEWVGEIKTLDLLIAQRRALQDIRYR